MLKALQSLKTPEEKLAALCKKYTDLLEDHRTIQMSYKQSDRRVAQVMIMFLFHHCFYALVSVIIKYHRLLIDGQRERATAN